MLKKSIYEIKQASRCWFDTINKFFKEIGCKQYESDTCLYVKPMGESYVYTALRVDGLLLASNNTQILECEKKRLQTVLV